MCYIVAIRRDNGREIELSGRYATLLAAFIVAESMGANASNAHYTFKVRPVA